MDAFYASVEQRDKPELQGKPVAVGGGGKRGVVAAASYEARKYGVFSAMPSVTAKRKCPQLIFIQPRFDVYKSVSLVIRSVFREYTDMIEPLSLDEAYLDVTTNKKGLSSATDIALEIKRKIKDRTALTASAGVSVNKFLAKVASDMDKPDGLYIIKPHEVKAFVEKTPVEKFFGVGKVTAQKMKQLGIHTGLDMKQQSKEFMIRNFGKVGSYFYNISRGIDERPVQSDRERKSVGVETTFKEDIRSTEELVRQLRKLSHEVARRIQKPGLAGKTLTVKIKYSDFQQITRCKTISDPVSDEEDIFNLAREILIRSGIADKAVRLTGITLSNLGDGHARARNEQLTLEL